MNDNRNKKDFKASGNSNFKKNKYQGKNNYSGNKKFTAKKNSSIDETDEKSFHMRKTFSKNSFDKGKSSGKRYNKPYDTDKKPFKKYDDQKRKEYSSDTKSGFKKKSYHGSSTFSNADNKSDFAEKPVYKDKKYGSEQHGSDNKYKPPYKKNKNSYKQYDNSGNKLIRLNKYIANAGICSRREADELIASGAVTVNGKIVTEMGVKVLPDDVINYGGTVLKSERNVYILLNKPKDFITTSDDPFNRKTVMSLVRNACKERVFPVGRLDRMTTGLLLLTNDGEMAKKLTHPKHGIKKIYQVELDKALSKNDMLQISNGIELEDGLASVDLITYTGDETDKKSIGIELHSGKNRIVRRIFEHLNYRVVKLDRVYFAGLTKKDLPRGRYRLLTTMEINMLKIIS